MKNEKEGISLVEAVLVRASLAFLLLFFAASLRAQDIRVNCSQVQACTLTPAGGIPWANGNQTWIFKPLNPRVSVYIFIRNYNSTSAHTSQTVQVFQTPFSQDYAPNVSTAASKWTQDQLTQNSTAGASCNNVNALNDLAPGASGLGTCFVTTMFAAQVAIKITGANTQAGSPDNFDLAVIQETGTPGGQQPGSTTSVNILGTGGQVKTDANGGLYLNGMSSQSDAFANGGMFMANDTGANVGLAVGAYGFNGSSWDRIRGTANSGLASAPPIQIVSDGLSQAFFLPVAGGVVTNPAASQVLMSVNANSGARSLYFDKVVLSCTAACSINVNTISSVGSGCSALTAFNAKIGNGTASTSSTVSSACTTAPTITASTNVNLPAGGPVIVDLKGLIAPNATNTGIDITMQSALTGNVGGSIFWYEK